MMQRGKKLVLILTVHVILESCYSDRNTWNERNSSQWINLRETLRAWNVEFGRYVLLNFILLWLKAKVIAVELFILPLAYALLF